MSLRVMGAYWICQRFDHQIGWNIYRRLRCCFRCGLVVLGMSACGPKPIPSGPPAIQEVQHIGLVDGFRVPITGEDASRYFGYRRQTVIRSPQLTKAGVNAFLQSVVTLPIWPLILIEGPDVNLAHDVATFGPIIGAIENGNELELPPHDLPPETYAEVQGAMREAERNAGFRGDIIMGGVYALTDETKRAILLALPHCSIASINPALVKVGANVEMVPDCLVGVHLYTISQADIDWLNGLNADIAITETGSPTNCDPAKLQAQANYQDALYAAARQIRRLKYFIIYQVHDGPTCASIDRFGILNKPAERFFQ